MRVTYQRGHLRCVKRKNDSPCWEFMWREQDASSKRIRRTAIVGTGDQYPTEELADEAVRGLRMQINQWIYVADLIEHYLNTELAADWHTHATRMVYREFLTRSSHS